MPLMIILKVTKNQGFNLSLEDKFFEKPQRVGGGGWGQIDLPVVLGLILDQEVSYILAFYNNEVVKNFPL